MNAKILNIVVLLAVLLSATSGRSFSQSSPGLGVDAGLQWSSHAFAPIPGATAAQVSALTVRPTTGTFKTRNSIHDPLKVEYTERAVKGGSAGLKITTWMHARIEVGNLRSRTNPGTGTDTNDNTRKFAKSLGQVWDHTGHIIASRLGGSGKDTWNIFPQDDATNNAQHKSVEDQIYKLVQHWNGADVYIKFEFNSAAYKVRPSKVILTVVQGDKKGNPIIWEVPNPETATPAPGSRSYKSYLKWMKIVSGGQGLQF